MTVQDSQMLNFNTTKRPYTGLKKYFFIREFNWIGMTRDIKAVKGVRDAHFLHLIETLILHTKKMNDNGTLTAICMLFKYMAPKYLTVAWFPYDRCDRCDHRETCSAIAAIVAIILKHLALLLQRS